jgi:hypothetical protein
VVYSSPRNSNEKAEAFGSESETLEGPTKRCPGNRLFFFSLITHVKRHSLPARFPERFSLGFVWSSSVLDYLPFLPQYQQLQ